VPKNSGESKQLIDTLKLSDEQWRALAEKIEHDDPYVTCQRAHPRIAYRKLSQIAVAVLKPDGQWAKYIVRSRDLSPGGIGFIHGTYLHADSHCRVILKDCQGQVVCLEGVVKRCELVQGTAHDIGVQFNEAINVGHFIHPDEDKQAG
jgi:PilZ domain-containing protein